MIGNSCPSHCCVWHGCKYGYPDCVVATREVTPTYPNNNGCEYCESDRETIAYAEQIKRERGW